MSQDSLGSTPRETYAQRLQYQAAQDAELSARESRLSNARLAVFAVGGLFSVWIMYAQPAWWPALTLPVACFAATVFLHGKAQYRATLARALHALYARAVDRIEDRWAGTGPTGAEHLADESLFGHDIDLFGEASLFQRLATTPTTLGHDRLALWLTRPADIATIKGRQEAVGELAPRLDLREQLAVVGGDSGPAFSPLKLAAWGRDTTTLRNPGLVRAISWVLGGLGLSTAACWAVGLTTIGPLGLVVIADLIFGWVLAGQMKRHGAEVVAAGRGLEWLAEILQLLEDGQHKAPTLVDLRESLRSEEALPSTRIRELSGLVDGLEAARRNAFYVLFAFLAQTPVRTALALDEWRARHGPSIQAWLDAAGCFEALLALGTYAYERPDDIVPELSDGPACFVATGLGHPLLPDEHCVRNDLTLDSSMRLLLLSGSNMSGKSTLLRAVGTNLALAMAGAPVKASSLKLTPMALGASIRIEDSLQDGTSHFYAEIKRLRLIDQLIDGPWPVLYLLDEVLHGTNSSDRLAGSGAIVKKFVERGALGIVTTHDLALARIADELGDVARNAHLEDSLVDGEMSFDYTLRDGVVTRGNALALMRSLGLEV